MTVKGMNRMVSFVNLAAQALVEHRDRLNDANGPVETERVMFEMEAVLSAMRERLQEQD